MSFKSSESGAVTVDWVVLTAALVGLGLAAMAVVSNGVEDLSGDVDTQLQDDTIVTTGFRTAANLAYGFVGAKVWWDEGPLQPFYDEYSVLSDADLQASYQTTTGNVQGVLDGGGWGPYASQQYHRSVVTARLLKERELDLPDGAPTIVDMYTQVLENSPGVEDMAINDAAG